MKPKRRVETKYSPAFLLSSNIAKLQVSKLIATPLQNIYHLYMADTDKIVQVGKYKVQVLRDLCIGAASCVAFSPTTFELDGDKKAVILDGAVVNPDSPENLLMAAQSCPTKAIVITDAETGQQVWPK